MFQAKDPATFWLEVTNFGLGVLVLVCCVVLLVAIVRGVSERRRRALGVILDIRDLNAAHAKLGVTMADGGLPLSESKHAPGAPAELDAHFEKNRREDTTS
jgi:hypothetical protein